MRASSELKAHGSPLRAIGTSLSADNSSSKASLFPPRLEGSPLLRRSGLHRQPQQLREILASQSSIKSGELLQHLWAADPNSCRDQLAAVARRSCSGYLEDEAMGGTNAPPVPVATLGCNPCRSLLYQFDQTLNGKTADNVPPHVTVIDHQVPTDNTQKSSTDAQDQASITLAAKGEDNGLLSNAPHSPSPRRTKSNIT